MQTLDLVDTKTQNIVRIALDANGDGTYSLMTRSPATEAAASDLASPLSVWRAEGLQKIGVSIKSAAGKVCYLILTNSSVLGPRYVKFYDTNAIPVAGAGVPLLTLPVYNGAPLVVLLGKGVPFAAGIGILATTAFAATDTGNPGATDITAQVLFV